MHSQKKVTPGMAVLATFLTALLLATFAAAQTETPLYTYPETNRNNTGVLWPGLLTQGTDGEIYSTIASNGANTAGTVYKMSTAGQYTMVYSFCSEGGSCLTTGSFPDSGVQLGQDGSFYGTTTVGGSHNEGTVFKVTAAGVWTKLWDFSESATHDEGYPVYPPFFGQDGNFYGVAPGGYVGDYGEFYKITTKGVITPHPFNYTDGATPNLGIQGTDGNFYGTTQSGGDPTCKCGVVYKATASGVITTLHAFKGYPSDGYRPTGMLVQGYDGNLYGTTYQGGASNIGSIFKVTPAGTFTLLYSFGAITSDAKLPISGMTVGTDGNLYGTTSQGGSKNGGALFKISPSGVYTLLYSFCSATSCTDGLSPQTPLLQHTNGKFYGNTTGNSLGGGVFFSLDMGLGPFVSLVNWTGKIGKSVVILGQGLTGTSAVSFDGVPASFKVVNDTYMTATAPTGALTGFVSVTTPSGTLQSNREFLVTPQVTSIPASATVGSSIAITGASLTQATRVTIGAKSATFKVNSDTQITATVPPGSKTGQKVTVVTAGGTATSTTTLAIPPSKITFSPKTGPVGTSVTIAGNTFTGATSVSFGGVVATAFQVVSDTQITATVPSGALTGPVSITTPGGTGTSSGSFTVTP